jgi:hypothetical protein
MPSTISAVPTDNFGVNACQRVGVILSDPEKMELIDQLLSAQSPLSRYLSLLL